MSACTEPLVVFSAPTLRAARELRVILTRVGHGAWRAQGLDLDLVALGTSPTNVIASFERDLADAVKRRCSDRLGRFDVRTMVDFVVEAPEEVWNEHCFRERPFAEIEQRVLSGRKLPFERIVYLV